MQILSLNFSDLSFLFVVNAILLLITSEFASPKYGLRNLFLNKKRLRNVAFIFSLLFFITFAIKIMEIMN